MNNTFFAHIFKRRSVGERQEVTLKLFNRDGSPANLGGSAVVFATWIGITGISIPFNDGNSDPILVPFAGGDVTTVEGVVVSEDKQELAVPKGVYILKFAAAFLLPEGSDTTGALAVEFLGIYSSPQTGDPYEDEAFSITVDSDRNTTGDAEFDFIQLSGSGITKLGIFNMRAPGKFVCRVNQTASEDPITMMGEIVIAKVA